VEVSIETPWDDIWIVPEYTKKARLEFTPKDIAMLKEVLEIFGGKVVEVKVLPDLDVPKKPGKIKIPDTIKQNALPFRIRPPQR